MNASAQTSQAGSGPSTEEVWAWLSHLTDPEIPVVTLKEMGILRAVQVNGPWVTVTITPTYNGCPAMSQIEADIRHALAERGVQAEVVTRLAPAWSTDWMAVDTHRKLKEYGIAPPSGHAPLLASRPVRMMARSMPLAAVPCPRCSSANTTEISYFGSTACKALYKCLNCLEPFDYFKPH